LESFLILTPRGVDRPYQGVHNLFDSLGPSSNGFGIKLSLLPLSLVSKLVFFPGMLNPGYTVCLCHVSHCLDTIERLV
jgi:hypothetical protein